jgi:NifB/MoaA-like Fe-S oxidoreductase
VGVTKYHRGGCRVPTDAEMRAVFEQVTGWQARLRARLGVGFAYLSDEWYLRLGEDAPPLAAYDGLDLTENGVGLVRRWCDSAGQRWRESAANCTAVTGVLFAPALRSLITMPVTDCRVAPVVNHFFGATVTAAGLLTGQDVVAQLRGRELGRRVLLPPAMFGGPEGQTLDEMRPDDIAQALGTPVHVGEPDPL